MASALEIERAKALAVAEAQAAAAGAAPQAQPSHYAFDGSNVPGFNPETGMVENNDFDLSKSFGAGLRLAGEGLAGIGGNVGEMQGGIARWIAGKVGAGPEMQETVGNIASKASPFAFTPSTKDIQERVTNPLLGDPYEPKTTAGEYARTAGEFGAGALAPGGMLRKAAMMGVPALLSETGGQMTEGTPYEPYARMAGGVVGGGLTVPKLAAGPTRAAARDMGVRTKAMTAMVKDMQDAGSTPDEIRAALAKLGPEGAPIDLPEFQQRGQRIYAKGGEGRQTIGQFVKPRHEGANDRIRSTLDQNLGPAPIPSRVKAELKDARKALSPEYEAAFGNARAVDTEGIANDIRSMRANVRGAARGKLDEVESMLKIEGTDQLDPHPRALHATREAIDGMLAGEADGNVRRILGDVRKKIDNELAAKVPGIKIVDKKYAAIMREEEAFDRGVVSLDSGRSTPRPAELADEIAAGGPAVRDRMAQGQRADIDRLVGTNANDRVALQRAVKGDGDWNRDKLDMTFGRTKTQPVFDRLDSEATFATTTDKVTRNSNTVERLPEDGGRGFGVREAAMAGGPKGAAYGAAIRGVEKVIEKITGQRGARNDADIARMLTTTDRNRLVTALLKANGGKPVAQAQIETAVRAALLAPGVAATAQ